MEKDLKQFPKQSPKLYLLAIETQKKNISWKKIHKEFVLLKTWKLLAKVAPQKCFRK